MSTYINEIIYFLNNLARYKSLTYTLFIGCLVCCTQKPPHVEPALMSIDQQNTDASPNPMSLMSVMEENTQQVHEQGLTLHLQTQSKQSLSSLQLWIKAGTQLETEKQTGLAYFTQQMVLGHPQVSTSVRYQLQNLGVKVKGWVSIDRSVIEILCLPEQVELIMPILAQAITKKNWSQAHFESVHRYVIDQEKYKNQWVARNRFNQVLHLAYQNHPNAKQVSIDTNRLKDFTLNDLKGFYQKYYQPSHAHLIYIGSIIEEQMKALVSEYWGDWSRENKVDLEYITKFSPLKKPKIVIDVVDHTTAQIQLAFPLLKVTPENVAYLDLLGLLLLGEKDGLLYKSARKVGIDIKKATILPMIIDGPGQLLMHIEVSTHQVDQMWAVLLERLNTLSKHVIPLRTLEQIKSMFEQKSILRTSHLAQYSKRFAFFALRWPNSDALLRYNRSIYQVNPQGLMQYLSQIFIPQRLSAVIRSSVPDKVDPELWSERFKEQLTLIMNPRSIKYHKGFTALGSSLGVLFHPMPQSSVITLQVLIPLRLHYGHAYNMSLGHWLAAQMSLHQAHEPSYKTEFNAHSIMIETTVTHSQLEEALSGILERIRQTPIQSETLWSSHFLEHARIKSLKTLHIMHTHPWLKLAFLERKSKLALHNQPLADLKARMESLSRQSSSELIRWYTKNIQFAPALLTIVGDIKEANLNRALATFASLKDDEKSPLKARSFKKLLIPKPMQECRLIQQTNDLQLTWNRQSYLLNTTTLKNYATLSMIEAIFKHKTLRRTLVKESMPEAFQNLLAPLEIHMYFNHEIPSFDILTKSVSHQHIYTLKSVDLLIRYLKNNQLTENQLKQVKDYARTLQTIRLSHPQSRTKWLTHLWLTGVRDDLDDHLNQWFKSIETSTTSELQASIKDLFDDKNMIQSLISPPMDFGFDTCKKINL
jgi:predicted Zn-dependent peptidase